MTILIIIITAAISFAAFNRPSLMNKLQFNASKIYHNKEYHRLVTHAFVHANWEHLIVNMIVLFSFGRAIERIFQYQFGQKETLYFLLLYFGGILFSNLYALFKHKNNFYYNAVGASGAVSAILFAAIFFDPWNPVYFFGIIRFPGIIFAALYLAYSYYMSRKQNDNVAHDAHFLGALFGFLFPVLIDPGLIHNFIDKLFMII
jgi:membrane associated rhomboid family serine protease